MDLILGGENEPDKQMVEYMKTCGEQTKPVMELYTINNLIAVKPFKSEVTLRTVKQGALYTIEQTVTLLEVQVVRDYSDDTLSVKVGDSVFIKGNAASLPYGKQTYKLQSLEFSLVPKSEIIMVKNA